MKDSENSDKLNKALNIWIDAYNASVIARAAKNAHKTLDAWEEECLQNVNKIIEKEAKIKVQTNNSLEDALLNLQRASFNKLMDSTDKAVIAKNSSLIAIGLRALISDGYLFPETSLKSAIKQMTSGPLFKNSVAGDI